MQPTIIFKRSVDGLSERRLEEFLLTVSSAIRLKGAVNVLVTDNREIRSLNARFKGKDYATDVLSFPAPGFARGFAGDIVISADVAARNAKSLGHSTADEIKVLALHGILHLAGYDHDRDRGQMAARERRLRSRLLLPGGLIERSRRSKEKARARSHSRRLNT